MDLKVMIVSTSIRAKPSAYAEWAKYGTLIVAGDTNTARGLEDYVQYDLEGVYLSPQRQAEWKCSSIIGWHSIQRRNVAILEAIRRGADIIVTVDDDNVPTPDFQRSVLDPFTTAHGITMFYSRWFDPCTLLRPPVHHRGFPYSQRHRVPVALGGSMTTTWARTERLAVVASLWYGDPDVDAMERLVNRPEIVGFKLGTNVMLDVGSWCPFNSQATAWDARYASLMMCWPGVGRFDDIWASYLARRVLDELGLFVEYAAPSVVQDRNKHDLWNDLDEERFGYLHTDELCNALRTISLADVPRDVHQLRRAVCDDLKAQSFIPFKTARMFDAWDVDVIAAEKERTNQ